jgi:hypothetical protein
MTACDKQLCIESYQKTTRKWKLNCVKRGIFHTENVTPLEGSTHLCNVSEALPVNITLVVYPEIVDLDELFMPVNLLQSDNTVNRWIIDDPFMFSGIREHTPTDPMNRIHWPATAKSGKLMVRKNEYTSEQNLTVILNMQTKSYEYTNVIDRRSAELGIKVAATLFDRALKEGTPVYLPPTDAPALTTTADNHKERQIRTISRTFQYTCRSAMKSVRSFTAFSRIFHRPGKFRDRYCHSLSDKEIFPGNRIADEGNRSASSLWIPNMRASFA